MGGYKIIDLNNKPIILWMSANTGNAKIDGIYEEFEDNYGKPILITGVTIEHRDDFDDSFIGYIYSNSEFISYRKTSLSYDFTILEGEFTISVLSDDYVHITRKEI